MVKDCWKCDEQLDGYGNYCTQCGAPQKPEMAAQSFHRSAVDFKSGLNGILDLIDGCPEMLAEGLADDDISAAEWERRFKNSLKWLKAYFYQLWMSHYDVTSSEITEFLDEHRDEADAAKSKNEELPQPTNESCSCGATLPSNPPSIVTRWKDAIDSKAVCFECFGQISSRIDVSV